MSQHSKQTRKAVQVMPMRLRSTSLHLRCARGLHTLAGPERESYLGDPRLLRAKSDDQDSNATVPEAGYELLRTSGDPLDPKTRGFMESRLGHDFSQVRIHTDTKAAQSAHSLGARAYTLGKNILFGRDQYFPETNDGQHLLAHELVHVLQQRGTGTTGPPEIGAVNDPSEREAEALAQQINNAGESKAGSEPAVQPRRTGAPVVQRTILGGILGGLGGALGGAIVGGLIGGPIGAIVGGIVGLIGGAMVGEAASSKKRSLTTTEKTYAEEVFKDSIDLSLVTITRDSLYSVGAPKTIGNTVHLKSSWGHFKGDSMDLTEKGLETLIHELGHVWQYQNGGLAYIPLSLWAQFKAAVSGGDRGGAYNWREAHSAGLPWEEWNPEQQAEAIEDYNKLLRKSKDGTATIPELSELSTLLPYMQKVWNREGAPTFKPMDYSDILR